MRGLLLRLSELDPGAEAAVHVIAAFDQLVTRRGDLGALVRTAASLAECPAGVCDPIHDIMICVAQDGRQMQVARAPWGARTFKALDDASGAEVWLDRPGGPAAIDEIVVERMAATAVVVLERMFGSTSQLTDAGAIQLLLSESVPELDRVRSARLLGVDRAESMRAMAIHKLDGFGDNATSRRVEAIVRALAAAGHVARTARVGELFAVVTTADGLKEPIPAGIRAGIGVPVQPLAAARSWRDARAALRFTARMPGMQRPSVASVEGLGPLMALAEISQEHLRSLPDVRALDRLTARTGGADCISAVDALCRTGSLRRSGADLFLHHTSVAARIAHASDALGFALDCPAGRFRAQLALTLWQLSTAG